MKMKEKVLVIVGPTASGKTKLAVGLARRFNGEIVSADSRQVYRGMDIGTGKDLKEYGTIKYYCIDIASPKRQFTVAQFKRCAEAAIQDIVKRGRLPIVVGGSGLYISALVDGLQLQTGKPDAEIRKRLGKKTLVQLLALLKRVDLTTYKVIDKKNRRRVERALEIYYQTGKRKSQIARRTVSPYAFLQIGVVVPKEKLKKNIAKRLQQRLEQAGMIDEVRRLRRQGVNFKRLEDFGLEYRYIARYLQKKITYEEMVEQLQKAIWQFSKRQMTWFKRDPRIIWVTIGREAVSQIKRLLNR